MEYFHLMMDERILIPKFTLDEQDFTNDAIAKQIPLPDEIEKSDLLVFRENRGTVYLVSDKVQEVLEQYEDTITFIPVQLVDLKRKRMDTYWKIDMSVVDNRITNEYEKQEEMVATIKQEDKPVMMLKKRNRNYLTVNLYAAESLLRRMPIGIRLCRMKQISMPERR